VCDQTVFLTSFYSREGFNRPLRRIKLNNPQTGKRLVFLTNNFALDALAIAKFYKSRWRRVVLRRSSISHTFVCY
jgi:hypothetical protein